MELVLIAIACVAAGFVAGTLTAFFVGRRFMRRESRRLYERWLRKSRLKRREWLSRIAHDIKNPLFLIQAFSWTYMDKFNRQEPSPAHLKTSSQKLAKTIEAQASKVLSVLSEAAIEEPELPAPLSELWQRLTRRKHVARRLNGSTLDIVMSERLDVPAKWAIIEEGLEEVLLALLEENRAAHLLVSFNRVPDGLAVSFEFKSEPPEGGVFLALRQSVELWAEDVALLPAKGKARGIHFVVRWQER